MKYVCAWIQEPQDGRLTNIWFHETTVVYTRNLGEVAYETLCELMSAVRNTRECSRCAKRRRIMEGTEHCMHCLLAPLEDEEQ